MDMQKYKPFHPSNIFAPSNSWEFLGFAILSFNLALVTQGNPLNVVLGLSFVIICFVLWYFHDRRRRQNTVISVSRGRPKPAKGLILLMSPFSPRNHKLNNLSELQEKIQHILNKEMVSRLDFAGINFEKSNLETQFRAIEYHASFSTLRDIWLICTTSEQNQTGSQTSAALLQHYVEMRYGKERFDFHRGDSLTVHEQDYEALWQTAERIFQTSGYRDEVMIADVTGGTKIMSIAISMACVPPNRNMQYMDARRDWQGNPLAAGEMTPVMINFDPILFQEEAQGQQNKFNPAR